MCDCGYVVKTKTALTELESLQEVMTCLALTNWSKMTIVITINVLILSYPTSVIKFVLRTYTGNYRTVIVV